MRIRRCKKDKDKVTIDVKDIKSKQDSIVIKKEKDFSYKIWVCNKCIDGGRCFFISEDNMKATDILKKQCMFIKDEHAEWVEYNEED